MTAGGMLLGRPGTGAVEELVDQNVADSNLAGRQRQALSEVYTAMAEATAARRSERHRSA